MAVLGTIAGAIARAIIKVVSEIGGRLRALRRVSASTCSMHILVLSDRAGPDLDRLTEWYTREADRRGSPFLYLRDAEQRVRPSCIPVMVLLVNSKLPGSDGERAILEHFDLPPDTVLPVELIPLMGIRWLDATNTRMDVARSFDQALRLKRIADRVESDEECRPGVEQFMKDWAASGEQIDGPDLVRRLESLLDVLPPR